MSTANSSPGRVLRGGEFYSQVARRERQDGVLLSELTEPEARSIPRHEHELAYFTVVLSGHYAENESGRALELRPFTAIYNPSGVTHTGVIGNQGARLFTIELRQHYVKQLGLRLPEQPVVDSGTSGMLWSGLRAYSAFKTGLADPLTIDSHICEMLAALALSNSPGKNIPRWFDQVKERLHEDFRKDLSIAGLAAQAGVHPVHLARVFRAQAGHTAGDCLRRLRVRAACDLLRVADFPLAAISAECGFADQSHFTRVFKRTTGTTPGEFRKLHSRV